MKILADTHTHTIASGHAYNTIQEMAQAASERGLDLLAITEHGPKMPGACHIYYFQNLRVVPRTMYGVELLLGAEVNIVGYDGEIDLDEDVLQQLDIVIASLHIPCVPPSTMEDNTNALIETMKNPYVNIIGHPDDSRYLINYEQLVLAAKEYGVILELNNTSLNPNGFRQNAKVNDIKMLKLCKEYGVHIAVGSDAHFGNAVADYNYAIEVINEVSFPEELIVNTTAEKLKDYLRIQKTRK